MACASGNDGGWVEYVRVGGVIGMVRRIIRRWSRWYSSFLFLSLGGNYVGLSGFEVPRFDIVKKSIEGPVTHTQWGLAPLEHQRYSVIFLFIVVVFHSGLQHVDAASFPPSFPDPPVNCLQQFWLSLLVQYVAYRTGGEESLVSVAICP